jgi:hypothetical protein
MIGMNVAGGNGGAVGLGQPCVRLEADQMLVFHLVDGLILQHEAFFADGIADDLFKSRRVCIASSISGAK